MEIIYEDWFKILCWPEPIVLSVYLPQISLLYTLRHSLCHPTWEISCHSNRSLILGKSVMNRWKVQPLQCSVSNLVVKFGRLMLWEQLSVPVVRDPACLAAPHYEEAPSSGTHWQVWNLRIATRIFWFPFWQGGIALRKIKV